MGGSNRARSVSSGLPLDRIRTQPTFPAILFPGKPAVRTDFDGHGARRRARSNGAREPSPAQSWFLSERIADALYKLRVQVTNETPLDVAECADREAALMYALVSTHAVLQLEQGEFVSLLDPGEGYRAAAEECQQHWHLAQCWLASRPSATRALSSPIILYDYPQIAPESPGDLCDGTEIDEILMLRIYDAHRRGKTGDAGSRSPSREMLDRTELIAGTSNS